MLKFILSASLFLQPPPVRYNERLIARMQAESQDPENRTRASRLQRWMELVKAAHEELQVPSAPPEKLTCLVAVAILQVQIGTMTIRYKINNDQ